MQSNFIQKLMHQLVNNSILWSILLIVSVEAQDQPPPQANPQTQEQPAAGTPSDQTGESPTIKNPEPVPTEFDSLWSLVDTFVQAMNSSTSAKEDNNTSLIDDFHDKAVSCLDMSKVNPERGWLLSGRLILILNRLDEQQPSRFLWEKKDIEDYYTDETEQRYFPHWFFDDIIDSTEGVKPIGSIVIAKQPDGRWLFSADSVAGLDNLYISLEKLPVLGAIDESVLGATDLWLKQFMPDSLKGKTLWTMEYWQWVTLFLFILVGLVFDYSFRFIVRLIVTNIIRKQGGEPDRKKMRFAVRPAGLMVMSLFWLNLVFILGLPDLAYTIIQGAARVFAVLACTLAFWRFTDLISEALMIKAATTTTKLDDVLIPLMRTAIKIFIIVFAVIYGCLSLNFDIKPLLGSLAIGGVGFAFAAKDTIENFFGSATVLVDQPFSVGDWVLIGKVEGTVETIGFRSTRIRTFYNSVVTIPNSNLVRATVDNYGQRKYRRYKASVGIQGDTPPEKVLAFTEGIRELIRCHPYTRKDYYQIWFNHIGESSLDILIYVFHETPDWTTELRERERLLLDILRLADQLKVKFAFPTQKIHLVQEDENESYESMEVPGAMADRKGMVEGIKAAKNVIRNQPWKKQKPGAVVFSESSRQEADDESFIEGRSEGS
jgi:MscS family membrane protein